MRTMHVETSGRDWGMATLVAITYPNAGAARDALAAVSGLQRQELVRIQDAIIATNEGDKVTLDQALNLTAVGAVSGGLWGGLLGLIFLIPVVGMAISAAGGAISGKLSDYGIDDGFAKDLAAKVEPGKAALLLLAESDAPDRVAAEVRKLNLGGEILYTNLSAEDEQRLRDLAAGA